MKRSTWTTIGFAATALILLGATPADLFRLSRPVTAPAGWARLELPDDVLDACRSGLPDIRLRPADGGPDVPYALEERVGAVPARFPFRDVEHGPGRETVGTVDRGPKPALAAAVTLEIDGEDFLKPVTLESSDDRIAWREFAKGSVFATRAVRSSTLRFAPNGRRWWRFRFDDRNGDPVTPRAAIVRPGEPSGPPREIPLGAADAGNSIDGPARRLSLPAANLGIVALRIEGTAAAYSRNVRVLERVFFRDEVVRRQIGGGTITRAADGSGNAEIPICDASSKSLEIEVEQTDGPPFTIAPVTAIARPRALLFSAPGGPLTLLYGSAHAEPPRYDVERALALAHLPKAAPAGLGPPVLSANAAPAAIPGPDRGAALDPAAWKWRQPIALPASGDVAYLDLTGDAARGPGTPRIVDSENRSVPYVLERSAHRERKPAGAAATLRGTKTVVTIAGIRDPETVDAVEISATAPAYFSRSVTVEEPIVDARGDAGTRVLGAASWEKRAEEPFTPLTIPTGRPSSAAIRIEIENGDNAPLTIGEAAVWTSVPRIDFLFAPGEKLTLLSGNAEAAPPRYDLELIAPRVLASPALAARVTSAPAPTTPSKKVGTPRGLWVAIVIAAALVGIVLARTLRSI